LDEKISFVKVSFSVIVFHRGGLLGLFLTISLNHENRCLYFVPTKISFFVITVADFLTLFEDAVDHLGDERAFLLSLLLPLLLLLLGYLTESPLLLSLLPGKCKYYLSKQYWPWNHLLVAKGLE
jgi:hypothetical protein